MTVTISTEELAESIHKGRKVTLLAAFWAPIPGVGRNLFRSGHIPTSLYCDPVKSLAGVPEPTDGRNPLPSWNILKQAFQEWGLNTDQEIVVYDESHGVQAARAWWILKWAGVSRVRILDGGFEKWMSEGRANAGGPGNFPLFCNIRPNLGQLPTASIEDVKLHSGLLIDARDPARFSGKREFFDLKAGHIPGAINIPAENLRHADHTFKSAEEIAAIFNSYGITTGEGVIVYSGSGTHSSQLIAAMNIAGITGATHFIGGWSQWSADPKNPVETSL